ncbi:MAG: ABC transporter permease subunit [Oscillospiraceae bacterium]
MWQIWFGVAEYRFLSLWRPYWRSPLHYEVAQVEGASGWEAFWKITFPMVSPFVLANLVYTIIDSFTQLR